MIFEISEGFQRKLDEWNAGHPNHPPVHVRWFPRAVRRRRIVWSHGVPVRRWTYEPRWQVGVLLPGVPPGMERTAYYLEGSGGLWFVKLFNWQTAPEAGSLFLDLDDRIFTLLGEGDMTARRLYEEKIEAAEHRREAWAQHEGQEIAYAGASHYRKYDDLTISMNPDVPSGGDWRWRTR